MTIVFPFSTVDQDLALKNVQWWNELGGCKGHNCVMIYDARCEPQTVKNIEAELRRAFNDVYPMRAGAAIDGWPAGANYLFRLAACFLQDRRRGQYFLWIEPDAIPLREGWADALQQAYKSGNKPFMGDRVEVKLDGKEVPLHMSGVGMYPNPLYSYAGEAYRAMEVAWDMAGKDQIVPNAYFTKLIEHAWKHPQFHELSELKTQIRPEAVLFHSSKDGSLIDLLRAKRLAQPPPRFERCEPTKDNPLGEKPIFPAAPVLADSQTERPVDDLSGSIRNSGGEARESTTNYPERQKESQDSRGGGEISCDIFIRTYPGDYQWLAYCVLSIHKFCTGFRRIVVVSPQAQPETVRGVDWIIMQDETEDGYLAQQITKLYADVTLDYQPDYILHVDSDVIFTRPTTPQDFFGIAQLPVWYYTPYAAIETPWQPITEKFMARKVENEFMRRFPIIVPRWLYPRIREFCHKQHGMIISQYIKNQPPRAFSEFNALGAFAWEYHRSMFDFVNTLEVKMPEPVAKQYHSWGGITPAIKSEIENTLTGGVQGTLAAGKGLQSPDITQHLRSSQTDADTNGETPSGRLISEGIKELPSGIWVLKNDTHVSKWVEQEQRLDHDQNTLPFILPHIKKGDTIVDCGAFIGDHTFAYSKAVGNNGLVYAFEPNPLAFQCLKHNMEGFSNVICLNLGLGDKTETVPLSGNNGNAAGAYVGGHMKVADVEMVPLDTLDISPPQLIKIDAEGYDLRVLRGAKKLIEEHRPILVIEINFTALSRQGDKVSWIYDWLERRSYSIKIMQENCCRTSPMYDILCIPAGVIRDDDTQVLNCCSSTCSLPDSSSPALLTDEEKMVEYIGWLKQFSGKSTKNRMRVMQRLSYAGLKRKGIRKQ